MQKIYKTKPHGFIFIPGYKSNTRDAGGSEFFKRSY